jgi:hypothetical protein
MGTHNIGHSFGAGGVTAFVWLAEFGRYGSQLFRGDFWLASMMDVMPTA